MDTLVIRLFAACRLPQKGPALATRLGTAAGAQEPWHTSDPRGGPAISCDIMAIHDCVNIENNAHVPNQSFQHLLCDRVCNANRTCSVVREDSHLPETLGRRLTN